MKRSSHSIHLSVLFTLCCVAGAVHPALAASVEVRSIQIVPDQTTVGKYPEILGNIKMMSADAPGGEQAINVIAVLYRPDHVLRSWTWKDVRMRAGETRQFSMPQEYEVNLPGTYKVDFNVYTKDMRPLHRLSRTFVAVDPMRTPVDAAPENKKPVIVEAYHAVKPSPQEEERRHLALGLYGNALNPAGGATMVFWPIEYIGLQATYTEGTFTSTEGRILVRFPREAGGNTYIGVGYLDATVEKDIIGATTKFRDSGVTGVIGAEFLLGSGTRFYAEITGASLDLKKRVENGGMTVDATVEYAPVSIGLGIVFFLF